MFAPMTRVFTGKADDHLEQFAFRYDNVHPAFPESILKLILLYLSFRVSVPI